MPTSTTIRRLWTRLLSLVRVQLAPVVPMASARGSSTSEAIQTSRVAAAVGASPESIQTIQGSPPLVERRRSTPSRQRAGAPLVMTGQIPPEQDVTLPIFAHKVGTSAQALPK